MGEHAVSVCSCSFIGGVCHTDEVEAGSRIDGAILACEEIFVNIVSYSGTDQVVFSSKLCGNVWMLTYEDNGIPFDPVKAEWEKGEFEDLDRGGMGILIARRNSKDIIYNRIGNRNVLTMVFDTANH